LTTYPYALEKKPCTTSKNSVLKLLFQFHKFSIAWASMRAEEMTSGIIYDFVFRTRPDLLFCRPVPPASSMFAFYRDSRSTGGAWRDDQSFGGRMVRGVPKELPLLADIVIWDDQFALMLRKSAEAYFVGMQRVTSKCYGKDQWAIACNIPEDLAETRISRGGLCSISRLVSADFNVTIRDCGDMKIDMGNSHMCEDFRVHSAVRRKSMPPLLTNDHWYKNVCNFNSSA
jgi:hypothetical protein